MFYLRLVAAIAAFAAASIYGVLLAVTRRDRSRVAHDYARMISRLMRPVLGLRVEIENAETLLSARPCVYLANHQSFADVPILAGIFMPETVLIAKRELRRMPLFGWIYEVTGNIYIDRSNNPAAVQRLQEAQVAVRERAVSVWMFPEGTRGRGDGTLLPFKKGAFYLAIAAGVPLVPIVVSPLAPVVDARRRRLRPGTVRIRVLDPVPTTGLTEADVPALIEEVRKRMSAALQSMTSVPD